MTGLPSVSVVLTAINGPDLLERALRSLQKQEGVQALEVLVLMRAPAKIPAIESENVSLVPCSPGESIPEMRARGLRLAGGDVIAISKDECVFPVDWIRSIAAAHADFPSAAIGGAVENAANRHLVDRAIYLLEYSSFIPPASNSAVQDLAASNVSYKRASLATLPPDLMREGYWETIVHREIVRNGGEVRSIATLRVAQGKENSFAETWRRRYRYGRAFSARRCRDASLLWRVLYAGGAALLPAVFVWRTAKRTLRHEGYLGEFMVTLPLIVVFSLAASVGELTGAIMGPGPAGENFA